MHSPELSLIHILSAMKVVCGNEISTAMTAEIGQAEKRNLICTTLDGLAKIKGPEE